MQENPLISIVTPVYNNKKYLPLAIDSVKNQTFNNWELIIVDDGSTDGTSELADQIASKDNRIRVIHQNNQWIYASMNNGISNAKGDYIYILNSDDRMVPQILDILADKINRYNYPDVIWTDIEHCLVDENEKIISKKSISSGLEEKYCGNLNEVRACWQYLYRNLLLVNQANLYRRSILAENPFRNDVFAADVLLNLAIYPQIKTCLVISEPVYEFYDYYESKTNSSSKYYGYEHVMYDEIYTVAKLMLIDCNIFSDSTERLIASERYNNYFGIEIPRLLEADLPPDLVIKKIVYEYSTPIMEEIISILNNKDDYDLNILRIIKSYLLEKDICEQSEISFVKNMMNCISCKDVTEEDILILHDAITNKLNPFHIGEDYYCRLLERYNNKGKSKPVNSKRALWIGNIVPREIKDINLFRVSKEDKEERIWHQSNTDKHYFFAICIPIKSIENCKDDFLDHYRYFSIYVNDAINNIERRYEEIIKEYNPEIIFICDNESDLTRAATEVCTRLGIVDRVRIKHIKNKKGFEK